MGKYKQLILVGAVGVMMLMQGVTKSGPEREPLITETPIATEAPAPTTPPTNTPPPIPTEEYEECTEEELWWVELVAPGQSFDKVITVSIRYDDELVTFYLGLQNGEWVLIASVNG